MKAVITRVQDSFWLIAARKRVSEDPSKPPLAGPRPGPRLARERPWAGRVAATVVLPWFCQEGAVGQASLQGWTRRKDWEGVRGESMA